ncbi:phage late control D family protein [Erwinia amylovora]|uniref:phage late control D family protein n=1 Tax=Erwinia amylovora TaxID=552 RepID=UPI001F03D10D|nr:phage late control D family protein [Erwinia amylovora]
MRTVYGVVHTFKRLSTSAYETYYTLNIVPRIALLQHTKRSEIYLIQSVTEGPDFDFRLSQSYTSNFAWRISVRKSTTSWQPSSVRTNLISVIWWMLSANSVAPV